METIKTCKQKTFLKLSMFAQQLQSIKPNIIILGLDKTTNKISNVVDIPINHSAGQWFTVVIDNKILVNTSENKNATSYTLIDKPKNLSVHDVVQYSPSPLMKVIQKL